MTIDKFDKFLGLDIRKRIISVAFLLYLTIIPLTLFTVFSVPSDNCENYGWLSMLLLGFGACMGSLIGALATPYETAEKETFKSVATHALAFATGVVWETFGSKLTALLSGPNAYVYYVLLISTAISAFVTGAIQYQYRYLTRKSSVDTLLNNLNKAKAALKDAEESANALGN